MTRGMLCNAALVGAGFFFGACAGIGLVVVDGVWPRIVACGVAMLGYLWCVDQIGAAVIDRVVTGARGRT